MAERLGSEQLNVIVFGHSLDKAPPVPYQRAWVSKAYRKRGNRGTFGIPIDRVLVLYWSLLAVPIVIKVEDIVLAFSLDPIGFPSLPVVGVKRGERQHPRNGFVAHKSTL